MSLLQTRLKWKYWKGESLSSYLAATVTFLVPLDAAAALEHDLSKPLSVQDDLVRNWWTTLNLFSFTALVLIDTYLIY